MTNWLSTAPAWLSFVVLVAGWNAARARGDAPLPPLVGATEASPRGRRSSTRGRRWRAALTALLFTFTIVTLWNQSIRAASNVDDEAAAMRAVARDVLPSQVGLVRNYARLTIDEWPQLCGGSERDDVNAALILLESASQPRAEKYADNLFQMLGTLEDMRNRRWQVSQSAVPSEIWVALFVLSCVLLVVLGIAMPDHPGTHRAADVLRGNGARNALLGDDRARVSVLRLERHPAG